MSSLALGAVGIAALLCVTAVGVPVGIAIATVGVVGMWAAGGFGFLYATVQSLPFDIAREYAFVVIPMFVFMGAICSQSGIVSEVYTAAYRWTAGLRGGLFTATTIASAGFAAISGSTVVSAVVFTRIALPEMIRFGYDRGMGAGCIAAAGTFAALIPPSLSFVIYGILTGESVGRLLMAGIVPGILTAVVYVLAIPILVRVFPKCAPAPLERFSLREKIRSLKGLWAVVILAGLVLGGIYTGLMPPSAAGAMGAAGALAIALAKRSVDLAGLKKTLAESAVTTGALFTIIIGGLLFTRFLVIGGFVDDMNALVASWKLTGLQFVLAVVVFYFLLGMFVDPISMLAMTIPVVYPIAIALKIDPIWLGVITVKMVELAVITPPVGVNLFGVVAASQGQVRTAEVFRGVLPFVLIEIVVLGLLIAFPGVSTWLPETMMGK